MDRRTLLRLGAGMAGSMLLAPGRATAQGLTGITLQLGWLAGNGIIGEVVAQERGFYADEGLDLTIQPGGPNINGVASVASGQAGAGQISSSPSLMMARAAGIPVRAIAAGYQKHPFTYFSLGSDPIRTPADLVGKTVATQPTAVILLRAMLRKHGIDEADVEVLRMGSDMNLLLSGKVQAVTGWKTNTGALSVLGPDRVDMMLWDAGIRLYSNVYYATDAALSERPEVYAGFLRATARGWCAVKADPEAAVETLVTRYPKLDRAAELAAVPQALGFTFGGATDANGWGTMDRETWAAQIDAYDALEQFKGPAPSVEDVMSTALLDMTADARATPC